MLIKPMAMMPIAMQDEKVKSNPSRPTLSTGKRQKSKTFYFMPVCFLLLGAGVLGCSHSAHLGIGGINIPPGKIAKIGDLQQNQNAATTVYIQGQVTTRAPFLGSGAYKLKDATGTIWVVTNQTLPNVEDEVLIEGQLQFESIPLAGQEFGEVYVREQQQLQRKAGQSQQSSP